MDVRIVEFAEVLRQNGLRVGPAEVLDAARAAALIGFDDRRQFKAGLAATLCKRERDLPTFERSFEAYFTLAHRFLTELDGSLAARLREEGLLEGDELQMVIATLEALLPSMQPVTQAMLAGDGTQLSQLFAGASLQIDLSQLESAFQVGYFSRRLLAGAGGDRAYADLQSIQQELKARGLSDQSLSVVATQLSSALRSVETAARDELARQVTARLRREGSTLNERPLAKLSKAEVDAAQLAVRRMAEKLKAKLVRQNTRRRRGALNVRRTLRRNLSHGAVPMVPYFRERRPLRPELVVLCDVSDSVRNTSRMMLLFAHTLQSLFARVRSFIFVSDVGEVTDTFRTLTPEQAVDLAVSGRGISLAANSNYGRALALFARDHAASLSRRTTVVIIGDGRNNYNATNEWALDEIGRRARRVVWLATESRRAWGLGDSVMPVYARHVSQALVVETLEDLANVALQLVPARSLYA